MRAARHIASGTGLGGSVARKTFCAEGIDHSDFPMAEFREMKMQPSLERALRHKEVLKA